MLWLVLLAAALAILALLYGLFRWASGDPEIDRQDTKQRFQAEQDFRALRRAGKL